MSFILAIALPKSTNDIIFGTLAITLLISFFTLPIFALIRIILAVKRYRRRRADGRKKKSIDERIEQSAHSDDRTVGQLAARVESQSDAVDRGLVNHRAQRYLTNSSSLRQQAYEELSALPPPLPQAAKRALDLLRVLLTVAVRRGMLGGQPKLTAQHLAKWAVLMSRWPELGAALRAAPEEMAALEAASDISELTDRLRALNYCRPVTGGLYFVLHSSTRLAPIMARLVAYEPVNGDGGETVDSSPRRASSDNQFGEIEVDLERLSQA